MKTFLTGESRDQLALLPASIDDYVPAEDLVRYVDTLIEELDLKGIEKSYSDQGRPAYCPRLLVKIILYGKMRGIRSGRELSRACRENLRFIFLARNEKPDFRTINEFRKRQSGELAGLLRQTIGIGISEGLIDLDQVCIDGTKLAASAGRRSFKSTNKLKEELDLLEQELRESFQEDNELEKDEEDRYGDGDGEAKLPPELRNKQKLTERLRRAIKEHEDCKRKEKPDAISTTDPECRMMKGKGVNPSYNAQAAIDAKSRMVVGGYVVNACCDSSELIPLIDNIEENTKRTPRLVSADKGYTRLEHLVELEARGIDGYVSQRERRKQEFQYNPAQDLYVCPEGKKLYNIEKRPGFARYAISNCGNCKRKASCWRKNTPNSQRTICVTDSEQAALRMRKKTQSDQGKLISVLRASTIEPLFGTIKFAKRLRQVAVRGLKRVSETWKLELAAYNIEKLCKIRALAT
jgi:transposase